MSSAPTSQSNPFPYHIFLGKDVNGQELVTSWRLKSDPTTAPKAWIWVIGTSSNHEFASNPTMEQVSRSLGRQIAKNGFGLITKGFPGVDTEVNRSFSNAFSQLESEKDINEFQKIYTNKQDKVDRKLVETADVIVVSDVDKRMSTISDSCILIGEDEDAGSAARLCLEYELPVFPIVEAGRIPEDFYTSVLLSLDNERKDKIYGTGFKFEDLKLNYKETIDSIMGFLDQRYPIERPSSAPQSSKKPNLNPNDADTIAWQEFTEEFGPNLEDLRSASDRLSSIEIEDVESTRSYIDRYLEDAIGALDQMYSENKNIQNELNQARTELEAAQKEVYEKPNVRGMSELHQHFEALASSASDTINRLFRFIPLG